MQAKYEYIINQHSKSLIFNGCLCVLQFSSALLSNTTNRIQSGCRREDRCSSREDAGTLRRNVDTLRHHLCIFLTDSDISLDGHSLATLKTNISKTNTIFNDQTASQR